MAFLLVLLLLVVAFIIIKSKKARKTSSIKYEYQSKPRLTEDNDEYKEYNKYYEKEIAAPKVEVSYNIEKDKNDALYEEEKDAWESGSIYFEGGEHYRGIFEIEIDYKDKQGLSTTRQVKVRNFRINEEQTEAEIYGFCYLRNATRTFYATRIKRCIDLETGEVVGKIPIFLKEKYYSLPQGQFDLWLMKRYYEIEVLIYIGRLDKVLRKKEKEIVMDYIKRKEPELNITTEVIEDYLKVCGTISKAMFGRHLTKLQEATEAEKIDFMETCEKIVGTKKTVITEEGNAIENVRRRLFGKSKKSEEKED